MMIDELITELMNIECSFHNSDDITSQKVWRDLLNTDIRGGVSLYMMCETIYLDDPIIDTVNTTMQKRAVANMLFWGGVSYIEQRYGDLQNYITYRDEMEDSKKFLMNRTFIK